MRSHGRFLLRAPALVLLLVCGCSLPGTFGVSSDPKPAPGHPAPPSPVGPTTGPGPAPILPLNLTPPESPFDQVSLLQQSCKNCDDDRKLLAAHLAQIEATLQERDQALADTRDEIARAADELTRARADIRRCKQESADLRERLNKTEKENIRLMEIIIKQKEPEAPPEKPGEKPGELGKVPQ